VIDRELGPVARSDQRVQLLVTIPGLGELLGLTIAAEIGEVARFQSARKLIGYAGLAPTIKQSGQSSWTGRISKAGSPTLRWAAIEAAQHSWRPIARKVLIACWHVLSLQQPFKPHASISPNTRPGKLPDDLAA
jgi:transposase